jgi:hypothetical protein
MAARTACTAMAQLLAPFSAKSVPVVAASPWSWGGCLVGTDVFAISSQTPWQAEFERVARVRVSKVQMECCAHGNNLYGYGG